MQTLHELKLHAMKRKEEKERREGGGTEKKEKDICPSESLLSVRNLRCTETSTGGRREKRSN